MPESKPKSLYLASCIEDLDDKYNIPDVKKKPAVMLCKSALTVFRKAEDEKIKGDEETSYVLFMKFLVLVQHIKNAPDYEKEKEFVNSMIGVTTCKKALDYARTLKDSLILRYELQKNARRVMSKENKKELDVKIQERIQVVPEENTKITNQSDDFDVSITPPQLYSLIHDKSKKVLILDIRPKSCYDESHIKFEDCVSIPEECIIAGTTANSLGKVIPESSKPIWHKRESMDFIIIYDWDSVDFIPGKPMHTLKTILLKWDPNVVYPRSPIALEGGYENWLNTYPTYTTNPHVVVPERINDLDDFLNDIEYPALQELSPTENTQIDRSNKPNNNYILPKSNYPSVDRKSKAAAIQTYEERAKSIKILLEEREKIAGNSLDIEKQRVLAEEKWEELRKNSEVVTENETVANQLREQELLSEIMQLESAQRDMVLENQQLRNQLEEYKKKEQDDTKKVDSSPEHKSDQISSSSISSLSDESLNGMNNGNIENNENEWIQSAEALDKENHIKDIEKEKAELAKKREIMQADREKILAEAREQKKLFYQKQEEEEENEYNNSSVINRSDLSPDIMKERQISEVPHFDRTTKPSQNAYIFTRERDFGDRREKTSPGLTGLKNMGFTCYMNSIMQCLNNTSYLSDYFCEGQYRKHINYGTRDEREKGHTHGMIAEEVAAVIQTLWSGQYRFISTRDLKNVVGKYKAMFRGIEQHDSHEFLTILIDWLHNDLQIPIKQQMLSENLSPADKAWLEYTKSKESLILRLFYGQTRSTVTCLLCGKKSVTYNSFSNLSLGLPADNSNRYSLKDCLKLYLGGEEIPDWDCPSCKNKRKASIKLDISKLPPVLIIHFNRFHQDYSTNTYKKKQTYIDFPLENLVLQSCQDDKEVVYNLYGVSNHYGTMEGGHYTAYCKSSHHKSWYKFDDHLVASISPSDVKSSAAYILFYTSLKDSAFKNKSM